MSPEIILDFEQSIACVEGRKTQHRVPISPQPEVAPSLDLFGGLEPGNLLIWQPAGPAPITATDIASMCPYGRAGESITLTLTKGFKARAAQAVRIRHVRIERLESITDANLIAEGVGNWTQFTWAWNSRHQKTGFPWDINPFAWVIEFELLTNA